MPLIQRSSFDLACSFSELALVKVRLAELNGVLQSEAFTANGVQMRIAIGPEHLDALQRQLAGLSRGRILLQGVTDA